MVKENQIGNQIPSCRNIHKRNKIKIAQPSYKRLNIKPSSTENILVDINFYFSTTVSAVTDDDKPDIIKAFILKNNYPNPFNPFTSIQFELPEEAYTQIAIYDLLGRELINELEILVLSLIIKRALKSSNSILASPSSEKELLKTLNSNLFLYLEISTIC